MKKVILRATFVAIVGAFALATYLKTTQGSTSDLLMANVEALANDDEDKDKEDEPNVWFSNPRWVECPLRQAVAAAAFYYKGVFIPMGATYTVYGNKKSCERELTINTCTLSSESKCE